MSANSTPSLWIAAGSKPASWGDLKKFVAATAEAHGLDSSAAVLDLERGGPLAQLLCAQLCIKPPLRAKKKTGPKKQEGFDNLILIIVDGLRHDEGLKGKAFHERAHQILDGDKGFFSEKKNVAAGAIEQRYYRARRAAKP